MKCIKNINTGEIRRVSNYSAVQLTGFIVPLRKKEDRLAPNTGWVYIPKSEWKRSCGGS
jgi:hypothetical protein